MKPSHLVTPRSLEQCKFNPADGMLEMATVKRKNTLPDAIVTVCCALAGVFVAALLIVEHVQNQGLPLP